MSAIALTSSFVLLLAVNDIWVSIRVALGVLALLLALKVAVAWRAERPNATHFEQVLRRLAFVDHS